MNAHIDINSAHLIALHDALQADMPKLRINCFLNEDGDYYNVVVIITSVDPKHPLKLDPENPVNECFISNGCLSMQEALEDMTATQIIGWMNQPLTAGSWLK